MRLGLATLTALLVVSLATPAMATPDQDLSAARDAFRVGACDKAMPLLDLLLYPNAQLARTDDLVEAHILLAVCHFESGNDRNAAKEFEEALYLDLDLTLSTLLFSEEAVEFFEDVKERVKDKAEQDAINRKLAAERDAALEALANTVYIERHPYWINFVPLGAGQFQNGDKNKGTAFFISEALLGGTSIGIFVWQWQKYGFGGQVPREDAALVRRLQQIQIVSGAAALGLIAWGIVDALINYKPTTQRKHDPSLLPADFQKTLPTNETEGDTDTDAEKKKKSPSSSLQIVPMLGPQMGGLSLSLEF